MSTMFADYSLKFYNFCAFRTFFIVRSSNYTLTESDKPINCIAHSSKNWSNYKEP